MSLDPITYNEIRLLREHFEALNGSYASILELREQSITTASFAAWMAQPGNRALFERLLATNTVMAIIENATTMAAVVASSTAMAAVAASSTAMAAMNASGLAMEELYKSPLATKANYGSAGVWPNTVTLRSGATLFVRLTTKAGVAGWGEGNTSNEYMSFDGSNVAYAERNANPYNHTALTSIPRLPMRRCAEHLQIRPYQACEITYIALTV